MPKLPRWTICYWKDKPVLNLDGFIKILNNRWLNISDKDINYFKEHILKIGYYRLSLYFKEFYQYRSWKKVNIFNPLTTIKNVIDLYNFDRKLKLLCFNIIEKYENSLKSIIIKVLSERSNNFFEYVYNKRIYKSPGNLTIVREDILNNFLSEKWVYASRTNKHFYTKYKNVYLPVNIYVQQLTLWWIEVFYDSLDIKIKLKILNHLWLFEFNNFVKNKIDYIEEYEFFEELKIIRLIRNIIWHHDILYSENIKYKMRNDFKKKKFRECLKVLFKYKNILFPTSDIETKIKDLYNEYSYLKNVRNNFYN